MRDDLKVSFVMPGYKCDPYINRAIESILDQDYENYEIIPVINGEWDTKEQLVSSLKDRYGDKINLVVLDEPGLGNADNVGFEHSTGDIISHLQSDLYLMPGALRNWVEAFEDHPDSGLVYSGYRLVSPVPTHIYYSNPYDRYHLECEPFVDGASPVRRKYWKRWSTDLRSLIDWDWALSVTEDASINPFYIKEPLYWAEEPKEGGLSMDSSMNWVRRRRQVQEKHGIPDRKICITSLLDRQIALDIAKLTDADFRLHPGTKPHDYRLVYCYGFMCDEENIQMSTSVFSQHYGHKIIHWSGHDIQSLFGTWNLNTATYYVDMVLKRVNTHWCNTPVDLQKLDWIHVNAEVQFPPVQIPSNGGKKDAISVNDIALAEQLRKAMPDQEIVVNDLGCRITVHFQDRVTNTLASLAKGNYVLTDHHFPGSNKIEGFTNVPELRRMIVHTIRNINRTRPEVAKDNIEYYTPRVDPLRFKQKLHKIAEKEIKKYARLEEIDQQAKGVFDA